MQRPATALTGHRVRRAAALALAAMLVVAGCGGSGGGGLPNEIRIRVLHFSPDSPRINVLVDNTIVRSGVDYKGGTGFLGVTSERAYDFAIDAILPTANVRILELPQVSLEGGNEFTLVAVGKAANDSVEAVQIPAPINFPGSGQFRVRLLHAVPDVGTVDVYLTAPDVDLATVAPAATLDYKEFTDRVEFPAGTYQVRITPEGQPGTVVFDSGSLQFPPGRDLLVGVVTNTGIGASPVSLVLDNGLNQPQVFDRSTGAETRVLHFSPNTPAIRVTADPATAGSADVDLTAAYVDGLPFPEITPYQPLPADTYAVRGFEFAAPTTQVFGIAPLLLPGTQLSVLFTGLKAAGETASTQAAVAIFDNVRPIGKVGQARFINGSPASGPVDVYVLPVGTSGITGQLPISRSVTLGVATAYFQFEPGNYTVSVATSGTTNVVVADNLALTGGSAFTLLTRDAPGGGTPLGVVVENDLD
ncbi:MAG: DUF4397 domain-containing protein [Chromatiales bacterium]|jgi:hypothetical protein|nr:DUF4397 domain-containing protein [Chromatiales bacterium]